MWKECSTGGGEGIKGNENGGPPTLCQPASQQGGEVEVNSLAGGAWRGLEVCWGLGKIFVSSFHTRCLFTITCELWIGRLADEPIFSRVEGTVIVCMKVKLLSFLVLLVSYVFLQCLKRS